LSDVVITGLGRLAAQAFGAGSRRVAAGERATGDANRVRIGEIRSTWCRRRRARIGRLDRSAAWR
jgi:hypothetical protein